MKLNPLLPRPELSLQGPKPIDKTPTGDQGFTQVLENAIKDVNRLQNDSDQKIGSLLKGETQDLHATILAVKQADTSFKMMMQVRNRIVEAYKEISRSGM